MQRVYRRNLSGNNHMHSTGVLLSKIDFQINESSTFRITNKTASANSRKQNLKVYINSSPSLYHEPAEPYIYIYKRARAFSHLGLAQRSSRGKFKAYIEPCKFPARAYFPSSSISRQVAHNSEREDRDFGANVPQARDLCVYVCVSVSVAVYIK